MWLTDVFNVLFPPPEIKTVEEMLAETEEIAKKRKRDFQLTMMDRGMIVDKIRTKCDGLIDELLKDPSSDAKDNFTFQMERFILELIKKDASSILNGDWEL